MCVRLIINVTQCYIPMYTLETLNLSKVGTCYGLGSGSWLNIDIETITLLQSHVILTLSVLLLVT